jgi:tetratricopeptide (TPR) repeat protein
MRATLAAPALARQAGRFVWLELDFDKPGNQPFIAREGVGYTPTLLVVDPADERQLASHIGGFSVPDLERFLDAGELAYRRAPRAPADSALAKANELLARGQKQEAAAASREALRLGGPQWPGRPQALASLTWALWTAGEAEACAETAAAVAPTLSRDVPFGAVVLAGFASSSMSGDAPWARASAAILEPLAEEAVGLSSVIRDHRFQLYQHLVMAAQARGDTVAAESWGHRWLDDIEAIKPQDDDERSALDIARVDAASEIDEPERVLPALIASEKAMPMNYNASLRLAQMAEAAKRPEEAIAACDRGLLHVSGPVGTSWLWITKANALDDKGDRTNARLALEQALEAAREIGNPHLRENNVNRISKAIADYDKRPG